MSNYPIPYIEIQNGHPVIYVKGQPFILLAGEVHNSDSSSPSYMEGIWDTAARLGMNTLLLPVSWELTEPKEGSFDFSIPQKLIDQARNRGMHIVFLWFGSWKNAECMYAPEWVKRDIKRFPRAQIEKGKNKAYRKVSEDSSLTVPYTSLSYLYMDTAEADAKAFAAFMAFIREYDESENTVVAVQVENEPGLLGSARERSEKADELFYSDVPEDLLSYLISHTERMAEDVKKAVIEGSRHGSWPQVFGSLAEEIFSAYHISKFVQKAAAAGKAVYPLPLAVNCWLDRKSSPGFYPSGGPVARMREVWAFCAPSIDLYCPDIYIPEFKDVCDEYTCRGDALFIPECAVHSYASSRLIYTVGHYHAMCYSPFGFDDIGKPFTAQQSILFGVDVGDPALKTPQDADEYSAVCGTLKSMMPMLASAYGSDCLKAVSAETDGRTGRIDMKSFVVDAVFRNSLDQKTNGACLCLKVSDDECYIVGNGCSLTFLSGCAARPYLDLMCVETGCFEDGVWRAEKRLNGDETAFLLLSKPMVLHVKFFLYN